MSDQTQMEIEELIAKLETLRETDIDYTLPKTSAKKFAWNECLDRCVRIVQEYYGGASAIDGERREHILAPIAGESPATPATEQPVQKPPVNLKDGTDAIERIIWDNCTRDEATEAAKACALAWGLAWK